MEECARDGQADASDGAAEDTLGETVAVSGDTVVASASSHTVGLNKDQGAAYVFVKPASGWADETQTTELTASDGAAGEFLGNGDAISIDADTIVIGAADHKVGTNIQQGVGYVYVKPASGWKNMTQTSELTASDGAAGDELGLATAISKDTVVLGSFPHKVGTSPQGAAYVFVKPASGWSSSKTQDAKLTASDGAANDAFGAPVGVSGDTVMVGALMHQVGANQNQGAVYLFNKPGSVWRNTTETTELTATDGSAGELLGDSAAISGNVVVAAAPEHTVGTNKLQGATYLFGPPPTVAIGMPTNGAALIHSQRDRQRWAHRHPNRDLHGRAAPD